MKERTGTVNCMIASIVICIIAELIGPLQFKVMGIDVKILTMIWVIIMGILLSPTLLGKVIPPLKKFISKLNGHRFCCRLHYIRLGLCLVSMQVQRLELFYRQVLLYCFRKREI